MMIKYLNKDMVQKGIETASPLISLAEWVLGIGGFAKAIVDTAGDANTGWSG